VSGVVGKKGSSSVRKYLVAAVAGGAIALVDYLLGLWMAAHGLHAELSLVDELLLAIFTFALVFVVELLHQRERQRINEKLRIIELMNHHVRNALQSIVDSAYVRGNLDEVRTSVDRIAWALEEILPGEALDSFENNANSPRKEPVPVQANRTQVDRSQSPYHS